MEDLRLQILVFLLSVGHGRRQKGQQRVEVSVSNSNLTPDLLGHLGGGVQSFPKNIGLSNSTNSMYETQFQINAVTFTLTSIVVWSRQVPSGLANSAFSNCYVCRGRQSAHCFFRNILRTVHSVSLWKLSNLVTILFVFRCYSLILLANDFCFRVHCQATVGNSWWLSIKH